MRDKERSRYHNISLGGHNPLVPTIVQQKSIKVEMIQSILITFDDNSNHVFTGEACVFPGDKRMLIDVKFFEPEPMPEGCAFEEIKDENKT